MLGSAIRFDEPIASGPAASWFDGALHVAYASAANVLCIRRVEVHRAGGSSVVTTGFPCGGHVAVAAGEHRLYVLFGEPGEAYRLTSTTDGSTFGPPVPVPITAGFVGLSGLALADSTLAVLWGENAGGQGHLLRSADGGATWDDAPLPFALQPLGALCWEPSTRRYLAAFGDRSGGAGSFTVAALDRDNPADVLLNVVSDRPRLTRNTALCTTSYHNRPGLHLVFDDPELGSPSAFTGRTFDADLGGLGTDEPGPVALELTLAHDGRHTWAAWRDDATRLWVAPHAQTFDLPAHLAELVGQECDPGVCPVDPRLVCAAGEEMVWAEVPARIANAVKGDVIMTPGDGAGIIGSMLEQLEPRQFFDHMGIMLRDHDLVRHATMAHDRLKRKDPGHFMTGSVFGTKAPTDGFRSDALTYGWPGTITQSVEDAFYTGFNTVDPATGRAHNPHGDFLALNPGAARLPLPPPGAPREVREAWERQQCFADPEHPADDPFPIHNFPNGVAYRPGTGTVIEPVVVKPAPVLEAADPRIRAVLHRVADAAATIAGHYRFFSYSDARIALDPPRFGPPAADPYWADKPPGAAWCAGTRPVVCSSFVWAAVQLANASLPRILLELPDTEQPEELLAAPAVDGLYRYTAGERKQAGEALHALLAEQVREQVYLTVQQLAHENRLAIDLGSIGLAGLVWLLGGPVGAIVSLLGVTPENAAALVLLFNDMPDDVATQMCNSFAADRADERDEDLWEEPGDGLAVSPDDIKVFWDPPGPGSNRELWYGLYGTTETMMLVPRRREPRRVHRFERSGGPAFVRGEVRYQGEPVVGARVHLGCESTMTRSDRDGAAFFELALAAGHYDARADIYWPGTQELLAGSTMVRLEPGDHPELVVIELEEPPDWRRLVRCTGKMDTVRRVYIGKDDWSHTSINQQEYLTWAPASWGEPPAEASRLEWVTAFVGKHAQRFNVRVDVTVTLREDLSLSVGARSALCEHYYEHGRPPNGDEIVTTRAADPVVIQPGGSARFVFDHNSGNEPPDRAHVEFVVENLRAKA